MLWNSIRDRNITHSAINSSACVSGSDACIEVSLTCSRSPFREKISYTSNLVVTPEGSRSNVYGGREGHGHITDQRNALSDSTVSDSTVSDSIVSDSTVSDSTVSDWDMPVSDSTVSKSTVSDPNSPVMQL